jgi:hypothetical protein
MSTIHVRGRGWGCVPDGDATVHYSGVDQDSDSALHFAGLHTEAEGHCEPRRATRSEQRAIAGADARCSRIYVSTINPHYASTQFDTRTYAKDAHCRKIASNGIDIVRRRNGAWHDPGGMSDCPHAIRGVPAPDLS